MAEIELSQQRIAAGAEYLAAIERLGLRPQALMWAYDTTVSHHILFMATTLFEHAGPLAISKLLFRAYNLAATPRDIDPFLVAVVSPQHSMMQQFGAWTAQVSRVASIEFVPSDGRAPQEIPMSDPVYEFDGHLKIFGSWIYRLDLSLGKKAESRMREWSRFQRNVDRLAA